MITVALIVLFQSAHCSQILTDEDKAFAVFRFVFGEFPSVRFRGGGIVLFILTSDTGGEKEGKYDILSIDFMLNKSL